MPGRIKITSWRNEVNLISPDLPCSMIILSVCCLSLMGQWSRVATIGQVYFSNIMCLMSVISCLPEYEYSLRKCPFFCDAKFEATMPGFTRPNWAEMHQELEEILFTFLWILNPLSHLEIPRGRYAQWFNSPIISTRFQLKTGEALNMELGKEV